MRYTKDQLAAVINYYKEELQNPPPEIRNILLYLAKDSFETKINSSVFFQSEALCSAFDCKNIFKVNDLDLYGESFLDDVNCVMKSEVLKHSNPLIDHAKLNFLAEQTTKQNLQNKFKIEYKIDEMRDFLRELPREWTILQITKGYNEKMSLQTLEQNLTIKLPIYLSILKHPQSQIEKNFICLEIEISDNLYKKFNEIQKLFISVSGDYKIEQHKNEYHKNIKPLENAIINAIQMLNFELGLWSNLFIGSIKSERVQFEIFKITDDFCKKHKLDSHTKIMLGLLLSNPTNLNKENCQIAAEYLCRGKAKKFESIIKNFLQLTKDNLVNNDEISKEISLRNPCLIIVDELLDHFPWEFINASQEFCRISSLKCLKNIYNKHKTKIKNGYLQVDVQMGHFLINPENNLNDSENRMTAFGNYWLPNFEYICGKKPSHDKIKEIFQSTGLYIYCGHGHGMDYLNPHKLGLLEINNPVVFLFGCDSVKLSTKSSYGEMNGKHLYFHKALCPVVIGCIYIAFDFKLDLLASEILSTWIPSYEQIVHWVNIDKNIWRFGKIVEMKKNEKLESEYNPRLAAILSRIRVMKTQKLYHLIPLVYRGIPAWNEAFNS